VTAVAQDASTGRVLMVAWMDRDALKLTQQKGEAVYWSRSRKKLWHKGEESGHVQKIKEIRLDCDGDVILLQVEQQGGSCLSYRTRELLLQPFGTRQVGGSGCGAQIS